VTGGKEFFRRFEKQDPAIHACHTR
jgi:hypothetical protein